MHVNEDEIEQILEGEHEIENTIATCTTKRAKKFWMISFFF